MKKKPLKLAGSLLLALGVLVHLTQCTSAKSGNEVLEPVAETAPQVQESINPSYYQLEKLLVSLKYEPVGIQYESVPTLELLKKVFSDPKTHNRMIKNVYTGLQMSFDKNTGTLTVGGLTNPALVIRWIEKHVPEIPDSESGLLDPGSMEKPTGKKGKTKLKGKVKTKNKNAKQKLLPATKTAKQPGADPSFLLPPSALDKNLNDKPGSDIPNWNTEPQNQLDQKEITNPSEQKLNAPSDLLPREPDPNASGSDNSMPHGEDSSPATEEKTQIE